MVRGFVAGRIFLIKVPFNMKTEVAPVSATACVGGIAGFVGCVQGAHTLICSVVLEVTTVSLSILTSIFWVGYKVGLETNVLNILILPTLPHIITYWATEFYAWPLCTHCTLLQYIDSHCSYQTPPGDLHVAKGQGMFWMYAHL
jgi:hypothetical protein